MSMIRERTRTIIFACCVSIFLFSVYCYSGNKSKSKFDTSKCDLRLWINNTEFTNFGEISFGNDHKTTSEFHCLLKCPTKRNCFYEKNYQNKVGHAYVKQKCILILDSDRADYYKNAQPSFRHQMKNIGYNVLRATNLSNILTLKLINGCNDIKKIVIKPRKFCDKSCTKTDISVEDNESDPTMSLKLITNVDDIASVATVVFNDLPACLIIVNSIRKIIWSDDKRGVIEMLDLDKIARNVLVNKVAAARSISADPDRGYLFWCNYGPDGSIERTDLHGRNRIDITRGKYDLSYPTGLAVDQYKRRLRWTTSDNVTHTADFNGNDHAVAAAAAAATVPAGEGGGGGGGNGADCVDFAEAGEHDVYWGKKSVGDHVPSVLANFLLSVTHVEKNRASDGNDSTASCSHSCIANPDGYHCVCLSGGGGTAAQLRDYLMNDAMIAIGFTPATGAGRIPGLDANTMETLSNTPFDYNLKTQTLYYYSMAFKQIRIVNMSLKSKMPIVLLNKITMPNNGLAYDWITNNLYFIDSEEQNIKVIRLNNSSPGIILNSDENSTIKSLAIHSRKGILFFIRQNSTTKIIYKMSLNGRNVSIITKINANSSDYIIIDPNKNTIYWLNLEKNAIEQIDFYGNHHETYSSPELYPFITKLDTHYTMANAWNDDAITIKHFNLAEKRIEKVFYFGKLKKIHESDDKISEFIPCFVLPLFILSATFIGLYMLLMAMNHYLFFIMY